MTAKEKWRIRLRRLAERIGRYGTRRERESCRIRGRLKRLVRDVRRVFAFAPTRMEPDLRPLYAHLRRRKIVVAFPKVSGHRMDFFIVPSLRHLRRGAFGIREPVPSPRVPPAGRPGPRDAILIPCLGLDRRGVRLGHGGGYYDRWLRQNSKGLRIAVLFECQRTGRLPHTSADARVHCAVTEESIIFF